MSSASTTGAFKSLAADDPSTVAGYRLAARLGAGGMGRVYLSYTPGGRPVAIKVIRPELAEDTEFRRRFRQEVAAAQRVQGLCTAPVIDSDTDGSTPWLATAYVPGPSLADAVARHGALPVPTVLLLVAGIAEALQGIHGTGIVHRDLKPSNVLLASDGPRVIDFGIARAADATSLTSSGIMVGTPSFMAPEQAAGARITAATDVFALGQVTAYAATGTPAFGEGTSHAVLYRIVHQEPDLSGLPEELRELVRHCLAKDPGQRPTTADVIRACQAASPATQLRRPEDWLPSPVAADLTERTAAPPAPAPAATPAEPTPQGTEPGSPQGAEVRAAYAEPAPRTERTGQPGQPGQGAGGARGVRGKAVAAAAFGALLLAGASAAYLIGTGEGDGAGRAGAADKPGGEAREAGDQAGSGGGGDSDGGSATPSAPPSPSASESPSTPAEPEPEPVGYEGINLPASYHLFLDSDPVTPRVSNAETKDDIDFRYYDGQLRTGEGNKLVLLDKTQRGSLETCRTETRFTQTIDVGLVTKGAQICVQTAEGHVGLVGVNGFSPESDPSDYLALDLTLWRDALQR